MASHHHHHHQHQHHHGYPPNSCQSSSCSCCCSSNAHPTPPPPTDPLLHDIATHLLHSQTPLQNHSPKHPQQPTQSLLLLHSLLRRVAALEASLRRISPPANTHPAFSLRDAAARIIQSRFRIFLSRRSLTLRQLKHLAYIKSNLAGFKSSLSDKNQLRAPRFLLQKASNLLQQLELIQSGDSMIRDGKRAIRDELVRLVELLNGMAAKRQGTNSKSVKKVTFLQNDNQSRAFARAAAATRELFPDPEHARNFGGDDCRASIQDELDLADEMTREIDRIQGSFRIFNKDEQGLDVELEGFEQISDDERKPRKDWRSGANEDSPVENGHSPLSDLDHLEIRSLNLGLSAPLPVKMEESRGNDLGKKKKVVRVIG
ncbi:hypothetical protein ACLOJK_038482 [Asimina triloba]